MGNSIKFVLLLAGAAMCWAGHKAAPDLPNTGLSPVPMIVQYKTPPTKDELKQLGPYGQIKKQFVNVNAVQADLLPSVVTTLELDPNVVYVSPDRATSRLADPDTAIMAVG